MIARQQHLKKIFNSKIKLKMKKSKSTFNLNKKTVSLLTGQVDKIRGGAPPTKPTNDPTALTFCVTCSEGP